MKKSGCAQQIAAFGVTILAINFGAALWGAASHWLDAQGVPTNWLSVLGVVLGLCFFSALNKGLLAVGMVKTLRFIPSDLAGAADGRHAPDAPLKAPLPEAIATSANDASGTSEAKAGLPLDVGDWEGRSREIQALGFEQLMDFTVAGDRPLPPGFARLFASPTHRARAELNQIFPTHLGAKPTHLTCVFTSVLTPLQRDENPDAENRWSLETSNSRGHAGSGVTWAMRRPRALWSRHPDWTPQQLLDFHLQRRAQLERDLGLTTTTALSWDGYCRDGTVALAQQRRRLFSRPGIYIWWCNSFAKAHRHWWGDDKNAAPPPI